MRLFFGSPAGSVAVFLVALMARPELASAKEGHRSKKSFIRKQQQEEGEGLEEGAGLVAAERGCPYAIDSEEEAFARMVDASRPGNVVKVEHLAFCRTGNHFSSVYRNLQLGYCCKSKVVWLAPKDDVLAPGIFNEGTPGPRWFDFSNAPDVPGFDSSLCSMDITWAGERAFRMYQLDPEREFHVPGLIDCIRRAPRLLGCEAAYYFPRDVDVCSVSNAGGNNAPATRALADVPEEEQAGGTSSKDDLERQRDRVLSEETTSILVQRGVEGEGRQRSLGGDGGEKGEGNLVIHVRSGDIFDNAVLPYYGQPPLQFYLRVIEHAKWDRVDIVTSSPNEDSLNPVIPALREKAASGELSRNINFYTDRSMEEDLLSMLCADGLVLARSTLVFLVGFQSKAKRIYGPNHCSLLLNHMAACRPDVQVFGMDWAGHYDVYKKWENTLEQRTEMLTYDKVEGLHQCSDKWN